MTEIKRNITVKVSPTPYELAESFCDFDMNQQADFFNYISHIVESNWDKPFCFQLQAVTDSKNLLPPGRKIMEEIGEYGPKR